MSLETTADMEVHIETMDESTSNTRTTSQPTDSVIEAPWRSLFFFTTKANLPVLVAGVLASLIAGAVSPAQSFVVGKFFDGLINYAAGKLQKDEFVKQEKNHVYYLLIISGISWISLYAELALWIAFGELQAKSARDRLFHGLLAKEIEWYDLQKQGIGALLPRLQTQIRALQLATSQPLGVLVGASATAILSLIQAFVLSWRLTLVTLSTVPVVMLAVVWVGRGIPAAFEKQDHLLTEAQKFATNALSAIETVKCFNAQGIEQRKYVASVTAAAAWYYRATNSNALQMALVTLLTVSMFVQGFYYGGVLVARGDTSTANVITTFMSAISAFQAFNAVLPQLLVLERGRHAGSTLRTVMAQIRQQPTVDRNRGTCTPTECHGTIEVKNLTFSYPSRPQHSALEGVSMTIPEGEITFLIGKSGSGKSTLGQLLLRFYSSSYGTITLDGTNIDSIDTEWLRKNITLVEQNTSLFNDTISGNIALGQQDPENVTHGDIAKALQFALLQPLIYDLADGVQTRVGYNGSAMSGGQRQRVALARARLRDTPVLILDESTSALDRISRALMMDAIRQWRRHRTTVVVTHDISQILPDDYLYILDHGRLVQNGQRKHLELLEGTPFHSFLLEAGKAIASNCDAQEWQNAGHPQSEPSSAQAVVREQSSDRTNSLEAYLEAVESPRTSLLPTKFQISSPQPSRLSRGSGIAPRQRGFVYPSLFASPPGPRQCNWHTNEGERDARKNSLETGSEQTFETLETFVHRAGRLAAGSRGRSANNTRQRANAAEPPFLSTHDVEKIKLSESSDKAAESQRQASRAQSLRHIFGTMWPSINSSTRGMLLLGFWGATINAVSTPVFSYVLSKILNLYSIPGGDSHHSLIYAMVILVISAVDSVHTYVFHAFLEHVGQRWVDHIRGVAMLRVLDQPRAFFEEEENAVSRITGCLDSNAEEMRNLLSRFAALVWIAALMCAVSIFWAMVTQWKMALIALATAPYIVGVAKAFSMVSEKWEQLSNDSAEHAAVIFTETFTNIKTVRALTLEQHFINKYTLATNRALVIGFQRSFFVGFFYGLSDSAGNFSIAMIFYVGTKLVAHGIAVERIIQVLVFLIFTITNLNAILEYIPQISTSKDMASRLLRLAQLPKDSHEHLGDTRILDVGDISFHDLQFSYPSRPEQSILKHFHLSIRQGTCTAIVGGSGSGKSTIANLLLKLYSTANPWRNEVNRASDLTLAGRNIKRIDTATLRGLIVPVPQTPTLFSATVAENIAYGLSPSSPYNNPTAVADAATQAGVHDFINSLPQGYDTVIGDGGIGVSGGQAQRIAIARALVRQPAVLILDEATSALDVQSADLVRQTIKGLVEGRDRASIMTVIIITHSREMMEFADNVVVLEDGKIVEEGRFDALLARKGGALVNLLSGGEWTTD